ncbi:hypothetical protein WG66_007869 [Moniliophthora roreri]|nr:hypothetical protein WG66_007869 [Moniliophthora roreri]
MVPIESKFQRIIRLVNSESFRYSHVRQRPKFQILLVRESMSLFMRTFAYQLQPHLGLLSVLYHGVRAYTYAPYSSLARRLTVIRDKDAWDGVSSLGWAFRPDAVVKDDTANTSAVRVRKYDAALNMVHGGKGLGKDRIFRSPVRIRADPTNPKALAMSDSSDIEAILAPFLSVEAVITQTVSTMSVMSGDVICFVPDSLQHSKPYRSQASTSSSSAFVFTCTWARMLKSVRIGVSISLGQSVLVAIISFIAAKTKEYESYIEPVTHYPLKAVRNWHCDDDQRPAGYYHRIQRGSSPQGNYSEQ